VRGSVIKVTMVSGARAPRQYSSALQTKTTYGYAKDTWRLLQGIYMRVRKTRIYGKGAEVYKSIYKKVHNTGN
jgi:hypothetical protein